MSNYAKHVSSKATPQSEPVFGRNQVQNNAGGFVFAVDNWKRLDRFLVLGSDKGSYYVKERELTQENAAVVLECMREDFRRTVDRIVEISENGRAPKNDEAVFALAMACSTGQTSHTAYALSMLSRVCRIGTHLFQFVQAIDNLRGWGRQMRRGVASWYLDKKPLDLAYQVTKYQQRNGWSHRDVLRTAHPKGRPYQVGLNKVLRYVAKGPDTLREAMIGNREDFEAVTYLDRVERIKTLSDPNEVARWIQDYGMVREHVPTSMLDSPVVWEALLQKMPLTAMIRNLGKMTDVGLLKPLSNHSKTVATRLTDAEYLKRARIHPLSLLVALKIYAKGSGDKGHLTWKPDLTVLKALDEAFYKSFDFVEPTNKNYMLGVDVSGSMAAPIAGMPLSCCEAATALALVTVRTEPWTYVGSFSSTYGGGTVLKELPFTSRFSLTDALHYTRNVNFGGTDCALPMLYATAINAKVDTFVILTDNETWHGRIHPYQALREYRQKTGIPAKLVVVGMTSNGFSIADPSDAGMLDVVGMSTDVPQVISDFSVG